MKNGFDFFKTHTESVLTKVEILEQQYGLKLPNLYKIFMTTFKVGYETCHIKMEDGLSICKPTFLSNISNESEDKDIIVTIGNFHSITEAYEYWHSGVSHDIWDKFKLFDIGYGWSGSLRILVGIGNNNADEIWIDDWDHTVVNTPTKFTENIFEFVKMFREWDMDEYPFADQVDRLYQRWGENFWRLNSIPL